MHPQDRIVVVADNCTDGTADVARQHGAIVIKRHDQANHGKGFALDFGVRYLQSNSPQILIMADADCRIHPRSVDDLVAQVIAIGRPAQACYLLESPIHARPRDMVSALACMVKNWVRPVGLVRMGLPCLFTGNGMCFPWHVIGKERLASANLVEDMQLSLDLAIKRNAPLFCRDAHVTEKLSQLAKVAYV